MAGQRAEAPSLASATRRRRCGGRRRARRTQEGMAAVPVGGGRAWPGFEPTRRATRQRPCTTGLEGAGGSGGHGRASRSTTPSEARVWRSRGRPGPKAPGKPVAPQAPPEIRWRCKHRPNQSELLVVLRVLVGLAAARTPERADRRHLFRRQREGEDVEVLALTLRVTGLGQGQGAELVVPAQNEA